jgi:hypothetical protein
VGGLDLHADRGQLRPETVMQVPAEPASLFLDGEHEALAGALQVHR